ncbi:hypothetical protein SAMN02745136_03588 [Anaerocolumna jejuensis DSM 15929]|uniref:Uncharacterized protein n=1 Tax=Anaerocolumna jejuensis DSM 15929 TaxID=1121322 RepID=A0A1M6W563_9FIRM|nr:hypothetical protein [Anaerocolumna jejuensis]SHK88891.1 hypothetical protein SAMN02745136_03588 [Anaerocolumna jejuensis DSM 15929]
MNKRKLKEAEERFFSRYPEGFSDPMILEISKKHRVEKMNKLAQDSFAIEQFENPDVIVDSMNRIISQSALISVFEKPKFKELVKAMGDIEKVRLAHGLKEFLYQDQKYGFEQMAALMEEYKLAKWPLLTACPIYFRPETEVYVKPTAAKGIIEYFELEGIHYSPRPSFEFYQAYREHINQMKKEVSPSLPSDNAAFCGFLMMAMDSMADI